MDNHASYDYGQDVSDVSEEAPALEQRQYGGGAGVGAGTPGFGKGKVKSKGKADSQTYGNLLNIFQCTAM